MGIKSKLTYIVFGIYLVFLTWIILLKLGTSFDTIPHFRNINLIPFGVSITNNGSNSIGHALYGFFE